MTRALLVTADPHLLDELVRLSAAAGVAPEHAGDDATALRGWQGAAAVLIGVDLLPQLAQLGPPRRDGVYAVGWGTPAEAAFRAALEVGAQSVLELPQGASLVTDLLGDLGEGSGGGLAVGVVGGSGGAGSTVFAAALARAAAATAPVAAIDADPLGPGLDRVLGMEERSGVRWGDLALTSGRLGARALRDALPRSDGLGVLTWTRSGEVVRPGAEVVRSVLAAARRGHALVVVDLPRAPGPERDELVARCDLVLMVVAGSVPGVSSAARILGRLPDAERVVAIVRGPMDPDAVAGALGVPVVATMGDQRGLGEAIDLGLGPMVSRRGQLGRAVSRVLERCRVTAVAA